jgi:two-component system, OmpR family, response regulator CpxR
MKRILIIDDDAEHCESLLQYLQHNGFGVFAVHDGNQGLQHALSGNHALVLLDDVLPSIGGFEVLRGIRSGSGIPVLMMAEGGKDLDRIEALEMGADDYLPKPFNPRELVARMRAILRRTKPDSDERPSTRTPDRTVLGDIEIDIGIRTAYREGRPMELTSVEFSLLEILLRAAGQIISREELARGALGRALGMNDRSIDVHISSLRKKLGQHFRGVDRIKTVRNLGYLYARLHQPLEGEIKIGQNAHQTQQFP